MAGTLTPSEEIFGTVKKITLAWTSSTAGTVSGTATTNAYSGAISRLVTVPSTSAAPDLNYDIVLNDLDGTDVLMGAGANRSNTATEQVLASSLGFVANDTLELQVSSAGNTKQGTAYVYIR
jgi:hypothetical protein